MLRPCLKTATAQGNIYLRQQKLAFAAALDYNDDDGASNGDSDDEFEPPGFDGVVVVKDFIGGYKKPGGEQGV